MFCQPPDEESQQISKKQTNHRRRRKKKYFANKRKKEQAKKKSPFATTMSSWAENFAIAATWQLKHQLAYWKARAKSLEYENQVLHDIIQKNHFNPSSHLPVPTPTNISMAESESELEEDVTYYHDDIDDDDNVDFEVSEEFIEFLRANAKYKEDARRERERVKAKYDVEAEKVKQLEAGPSQPEDSDAKFKELYGVRWQRVAALEMSLQSHFIHESDKEKPQYWPNIPFNFNCE